MKSKISKKDFAYFMAVLVICGLILPADFSTAAMLLIVCFTMIFIGGAQDYT